MADGSRFTPVGERQGWQGRVVSLAVAEIRAPDGSIHEREIIRHPGAAVIVPLDGEEVIMIRQYRAAVNREMLEIPAGKLDSRDEPPAHTARRELEEEIGKRAGHLELLAVFHNSPGFCDEETHCYLATELIDADRHPHGIEEEHMAIERIRLADVPDLVASGELIDAKSIIGLMLARERLG
ncbi:NUDIX hydrolase [Candidatus Poriferisocius sp.]|uniref:NUDIX hydrolase n=1 Tax=Candidatus Poriferisocius sp. TaxID=3101276 RepID=UPI003B02174E